MSPHRKLRVLFVAPDCNPQWHSLPALIAEYLDAVSRRVDVTLVTQVRNREHLSARFPELDIIYLDTEAVERPVHRFTQWVVRDPNKAMTLQVALRYPSSYYFEARVWRALSARVRRGEFDVLHRASPMSPTSPCPLAVWSPIPVVLGPVLGGLAWPKVFRGEMRREREVMNYLRGSHRLLPYHRSAYAKAAAILAAYPHTIADLPPGNEDRIFDFTEGGVWLEDYPPRERARASSDGRATVLFVGRMVPFKQPEVLIRAFEQSPLLQRQRLLMVGDGPERDRLSRIVAQRGLTDCVELPGSLPFARVRELMYAADVFAFPSIREQGGGVLTMASMAETPSVVVDYGGPAHRVPDGCGVRVPLTGFDGLVTAYREALEALVQDPEQIRQMGRRARAFTETNYAWSRKAERTEAIYEWVLGRRSERPAPPPAAPAEDAIAHRTSA